MAKQPTVAFRGNRSFDGGYEFDVGLMKDDILDTTYLTSVKFPQVKEGRVLEANVSKHGSLCGQLTAMIPKKGWLHPFQPVTATINSVDMSFSQEGERLPAFGALMASVEQVLRQEGVKWVSYPADREKADFLVREMGYKAAKTSGESVVVEKMIRDWNRFCLRCWNWACGLNPESSPATASALISYGDIVLR